MFPHAFELADNTNTDSRSVRFGKNSDLVFYKVEYLSVAGIRGSGFGNGSGLLLRYSYGLGLYGLAACGLHDGIERLKLLLAKLTGAVKELRRAELGGLKAGFLLGDPVVYIAQQSRCLGLGR